LSGQRADPTREIGMRRFALEPGLRDLVSLVEVSLNPLVVEWWVDFQGGLRGRGSRVRL